jgi:hypothetical protein
MSRPFFIRLIGTCLLVLLSSAGAAFTPDPSDSELDSKTHYNDPLPTTVLVRVVAHRSLVLGHDVGGARVTMTDVASGQLLASGLQQGEPGDQTQIMRTPHLMDEPVYSARPAASYTPPSSSRARRSWKLPRKVRWPTPTALQRASTTVLLIPGHDLTNDGIVLHLYGYLLQIEHPKPGEPLIAKEDVMLRASVRTLSGALVRPHSDWDSRKIHIYAELLIGDQHRGAPANVLCGREEPLRSAVLRPDSKDAPDGITLRVIAADTATGNFGMGTAQYPVLSERLRPRKN